SGWDLKSGAGRLNVFRALSVLAPSVVKFEHPYMDFSTFSDTLNINATILSAYFQSFDLLFGVGYNPNSWTKLIEDGKNQFIRKNIFNLSLINLKDSTYTIRIVVKQSNNRTLEERVHFHINRTPPKLELVSIGPCLYGNKNTILTAAYTDEPSVVRLYFKPKSAPDNNFKFVTLDGFTINNQFVKQLHYGFIPVNLISQNTEYDVYLEAENLVGLKTILKNNNSYFNVSLMDYFRLSSFNYLSFELPPGSLYPFPLSILSSNDKEIIIRESLNQRVSKIYSFTNNTFSLKDSISDRIIKDHGDFNKNGRLDLLALFVRDGFILEQDNLNSSKFSQKFSRSGGDFWPILAKDFDNDGRTEILAVKNDTTISLWELPSNQSLVPTEKVTFRNFTKRWMGQNKINSPNAIILDSNQDGIQEVWLLDEDGDLFSFEIKGDNNLTPYKAISTEFYGNSAYLTNGDFDGDGKQEIVVLLHSIEKFDLAPYYRLIVFNFQNDLVNVLFDHPFIDASYEYSNTFRKAENAIRLSDLDNDGKQELILFTFPYAYVFKHYTNGIKIIAYFENVNSNSILISDFNKNDIKELALPKADGIKFIEFLSSNTFPIPVIIEGYSLDSSIAKISWSGESDYYKVFRGSNPNNLTHYKTVNYKTLVDSNLTNNSFYYYSIQSVDSANPTRNSSLSQIKEIYVKNKTKVVEVKASSQNTIIVTFNNKIRTTIDNLQSFKVMNFGYPNSISPYNQFSYLIKFNKNLGIGNHYLIVDTLVDFYDSPISKDTISFLVNQEQGSEYLFINNFELINPYKIKIEFSDPLEPSSALDKNNYVFNPQNFIKNIYFENNSNKNIILDLQGGKPIGSIGIEYVLKIINLRSDSRSGSKTITEGAGSYIVFSQNKSNLSELYSYPNPVKVNYHNYLTFANLTKRTKIQIFNIQGTLIREIQSINESGGLDYDLKNNDGDKLPSGVYFYIVTSLDDLGREVETKTGKFAVIR
ncbi:MAG: T9SS type A sorting domain-containing protein, partial [Ignavibacterium sp.]|nr:T9SS type A sorting domain-containing protein [Ignavibacterium sp.]